MIPDKIFEGIDHRFFRSAARRAVAAFPPPWADSAGTVWYAHCQLQDLAVIDNCGDWRLMAPAKPPAGGGERNFMEAGAVADDIQRLIPQIRRGDSTDGG